MIKIKKFRIILFCLSLLMVSCVKHEVSFKGESDIGADGTLNRSAAMQIMITGERDTADDSSGLGLFYEENYVSPDENLFEITREYHDSVLTISWTGEITPDKMPVGDYIHKSKDGATAINDISVKMKNRWFYKDIEYRETFEDPVDTVKYYPVIRQRLGEASGIILGSGALKGIPDSAGARDLLKGIETEGGIDLFRGIIADPSGIDSLSQIYDGKIAEVSDSLAGFRGVKENPDSLGRLIHNIYDAAWDTLMSDHPGIFGSFPIGDIDIHNFTIRVSAPGCLVGTNCDTTTSKASVWTFNRMDFFARQYAMELTVRHWLWWNVGITVVVVALILFFILGASRRKKTI